MPTDAKRLPLEAEVIIQRNHYRVKTHEWGPTYMVQAIDEKGDPEGGLRRLQAYNWDEIKPGVYRIHAFSGPL